MCTTHNVGQSSMLAIQQELEKGARVTDEIMVGRRPWRDLFAKHTFFTTGFRYYLTVISSSKTKEAHNKWSSFIESRVRFLVQKLDMHPSIALARPFNKGFDRVHQCRLDTEVEEIQGGSLAYQVKPEDLEKAEKADIKNEARTEAADGVKTEVKSENGEPPLKAETADEVKVADRGGEDGDDKVKLGDIPEYKPDKLEVYTTNHYIGLQLADKAKSLDLSREVNDFKAMCISNDIYKGELMCLTIQHVKNFDLPDDVFEPGEVKPTRPLRKKRLASEEPTKPNVKRQATATAAG